MVFFRRRTLGMRFRARKKRAPLRRTRRIARAIPVKVVRPRRRTGPTRKKEGIVRDRRIVTLRYVEHLVQAADATVATHQFRANSVFDPDLSGVGHQPRGFDQWMVLYSDWAVLSSTIMVKASKPSTSAPMALSVHITETGITPDATFIDMMENNPRTTRVLGSAGNGFPMTTVRTSVNVAKYLNRSGGIADDLDLHGTDSANPSKQIIYHVNTVRAGAASAGDADLWVTITYRVMMLLPRKFGPS